MYCKIISHIVFTSYLGHNSGYVVMTALIDLL